MLLSLVTVTAALEYYSNLAITHYLHIINTLLTYN